MTARARQAPGRAGARGLIGAGRRARGAERRGDASARERILDAAVERIASDGIDEVRIARIAMDAGVSTSLVHYHFETREALLEEALEHSYVLAGDVRMDEGEGSERDRPRQLATMIDQCLPFPGSLERDWMLWAELWLRAARSEELRPIAARLYARMHAWFRAPIAAGVAEGAFNPCDPDAIAHRALALCDGFGIRVLDGDPAMPLVRARHEIWRALAPDLGLAEEMPSPEAPGAALTDPV